MRALERACSLHGVDFQEGSEVEDLTIEKNKITGATVLCATGELKKITCEKAIICSGAWSKKIFNKIPVFPVKGQMLSIHCLLYTSPSPRDAHESRMPSSA